MSWLAALCLAGILAGFLLIWRVPIGRATGRQGCCTASVIIPARNEEQNLPALLESLRKQSEQPAEVIVVDDASTDRTAEVARRFGARVIASRPLPAGWTGKTWACHQGALAATSDTLFFLDADTSFLPGGYSRIMWSYCRHGGGGIALSVLPYHWIRKPYEQLSLFFNLLMAAGAGEFGLLSQPRLFGQSLVIARKTYEASGGHRAVAGVILENFALSARLEANGVRCVTLGGRGALNVRMFPHGVSQLCEGWSKAFADGAAGSDIAVLGVSIFWLASLAASFLAILFARGLWREVFLSLYAGFALQLFWLARRVGNYSALTCLLYPISLVFYFGIFGQSLFRRIFKRKVSWRGRSV